MARKIHRVRYLSRNLSLGFPGVICDLLSRCSAPEQEVRSDAHDQGAGDLLQDAVGAPEPFRLEHALRRSDGGPGNEDKGRMPQRIDKEQEAPVKDVRLLR